MSGTVIGDGGGISFGSFLNNGLEYEGLITRSGSIISQTGPAIVMATSGLQNSNTYQLENQGNISALRAKGVAFSKGEDVLFTNSGTVSAGESGVSFSD